MKTTRRLEPPLSSNEELVRRVVRATMPPRMPAKAAVDPAWGEKCHCPEGDNWRFQGSTQLKCPKCGGWI